jgi:hypothetical protein
MSNTVNHVTPIAQHAQIPHLMTVKIVKTTDFKKLLSEIPLHAHLQVYPKERDGLALHM